jgi:hypothetical protein
VISGKAVFGLVAASIVALATLGTLDLSMRLERRGGIIEVALATEMTVAIRTIETLDQSMRIEARGGIIEVALATEMSRVTTCSCAVDGSPSTVGIVCEGARAKTNGGTV